jgi:hypothetical protein
VIFNQLVALPIERGYRRYLPTNDYRRGERIFSSVEQERFHGAKFCNDVKKRLQYQKPEFDSEPRMKTYSDYLRNGQAALGCGKAVDGVKGIWVFHSFPYASKIDWVCDPMHCFTNIIRDSIQVLKSGNRTCEQKVAEALVETKLFPHLHPVKDDKSSKKTFQTPAWVLTSEEIHSVKNYMKQCGHIRSRIQDPIATCGGKFSHDKLMYALNFARESLEGKGDAAVMDNILDLFDIIGYLWRRSFSIKELMEVMIPHLKGLLSNREGLLPPCELTYALHGIIHVADQIQKIGPPRLSSMYSYERANKKLKGLIMNTSAPISSLMKNYLLSEISVFSSGFHIGQLKNLEELFHSVDPVIASRLAIGLKGLDSLIYDEENDKLSTDPNYYAHDEDCRSEEKMPKDFKILPRQSVLNFLHRR